MLRDPGPKTEEVGGAGLLCVENDDPTAEAQARLFAEVGIAPEQVTPWNAYPWRLGRAPTAGELEEGVGPLLDVVDLLPHLRVVLLQGGEAQEVWRRALRRRPQLESERRISVIGTYHRGEAGAEDAGSSSGGWMTAGPRTGRWRRFSEDPPTA